MDVGDWELRFMGIYRGDLIVGRERERERRRENE